MQTLTQCREHWGVPKYSNHQSDCQIRSPWDVFVIWHTHPNINQNINQVLTVNLCASMSSSCGTPPTTSIWCGDIATEQALKNYCFFGDFPVSPNTTNTAIKSVRVQYWNISTPQYWNLGPICSGIPPIEMFPSCQLSDPLGKWANWKKRKLLNL